MQRNLPKKTFDEVIDEAYSHYMNTEFDGVDENGFHLLDTPRRNELTDDLLWRRILVRHLNDYLYN